jgi:hypothetical protein
MGALFAETAFQAAFDRASAAAFTLFEHLSREGSPIPSEWPQSRAEMDDLVHDLVPTSWPESSKRLLTVSAFCGARLAWRRLLDGRLRQSGVIRQSNEVDDVDPQAKVAN